MAELNSWNSPLSLNERSYWLKSLGMWIRPNPVIPGSDAPFGGDGGRFGDHQCGPAYRSRSQVDQVPVIGHPFSAGVLAHGGDKDSVLEFGITQFQW
jgi:hypothetical protein